LSDLERGARQVNVTHLTPQSASNGDSVACCSKPKLCLPCKRIRDAKFVEKMREAGTDPALGMTPERLEPTLDLFAELLAFVRGDIDMGSASSIVRRVDRTMKKASRVGVTRHRKGGAK
jgi:hypothetical protein